MVEEVKKEAFISCELCSKQYRSGIFMDKGGSILIDEGKKDSRICPACSHKNMGTLKLNWKVHKSNSSIALKNIVTHVPRKY